MSTNNSKTRFLPIAAVAILALLAGNIFLIFNKMKQDKVIDEQVVEIDEAKSLQVEAEEQYYKALSSLEEMRGSNEELNALIEKQKMELSEQKSKINALIRTKSDLSKAREEIAVMSSQIEQYFAEIDQLKKENEALQNQNQQLASSNQELNTNLEKERVAKEELETAKAALVSEKADLQEQTQRLSQKVNIASIIKVDDITAMGIKQRNSGKEVDVKSAKKADIINVCFATEVNNVVPRGSEKFYVRIINPIGETMAVESEGSGVFTSEATKESIRYTKTVETEYDRGEEELCMQWTPSTELSAGTYEVEVYNKGFLSGKGSFTLK